MSRSFPILALMLVATLAGARALSAAPPVPPAPEGTPAPLVERATVELVLIEAYVTDGRGRPLRGLAPGDFTLLVDGYQKPIHSLEFREVAAPATGRAADAGSAGASETPAARPRRLPRRFVLFFEDSTSLPEGLAAARLAVRRFLDSALLPEDEVALASYDRKLRILHEFSTDRAALDRAVEESLHDPRRFNDYASEEAGYDRDLSQLMAQSNAPMAGSSEATARQVRVVAMNYASTFTPRMRGILRALTTLVDSLAPYPGYKGIVFMGDGIAENPAVDLMQRFVGRAPTLSSELQRYDLSHEIQQLAHRASASGVTLHSVQTTGQPSITATQMRAFGRRSNALDTLALNTGGTKSSSNDFAKALSQAESASRAYYVIGYAPEGPPDGRYHTVQLRLKNRSGSLSWRRGFTRLPPDQARERAVQAAYFLPELYTDLGIEISAVPGPAAGTARVYDLVVHVPPGRALFVPRPDGAAARLEAGYVLIDESLRETRRAAIQAQITLTGALQTARLGVDFYSRVRVPAEGQTVTAVVSDQEAGALGAARMLIPPAAGAARQRALGLSTYSLSENSLWIEIPASGEASPLAGTTAEYTIGPALKATFALGEPVACGFRLEETDAPEKLLLMIRQGERDVRSVDLASSFDDDASPRPGTAIKVKLPLDGLAAGDYLLVVRRNEAGGATLDAGTAPLRLRAVEGADAESARSDDRTAGAP